MAEFASGQHLLAFPEIKRFVLVNLHSKIEHLVTNKMLQDAFGEEYDKIMSNRNDSWFVYEYFE